MIRWLHRNEGGGRLSLRRFPPRHRASLGARQVDVASSYQVSHGHTPLRSGDMDEDGDSVYEGFIEPHVEEGNSSLDTPYVLTIYVALVHF